MSHVSRLQSRFPVDHDYVYPSPTGFDFSAGVRMKLSNRKQRHDSEVELSMTSMIDVVFLLLIFFMTTASFVNTERNLDSGIKVEKKSSRATSDLEPAIVEVLRSGERFVFRLGSREFSATSELIDVLRQFDNKHDGAFVRVSDEAPFRMAAAAVQACRHAGYAIVSYVPFDNHE